MTKIKRPPRPKSGPKSTRASVSFPRDLYGTVEQLAAEKKVSVAWIVRDAVEKYVAAQWPLFTDGKRKNPSI